MEWTEYPWRDGKAWSAAVKMLARNLAAEATSHVTYLIDHNGGAHKKVEQNRDRTNPFKNVGSLTVC
jgi:hypothetical protein